MNPDPVCIFIVSCLILSALCVWYASDMRDVNPAVDDDSLYDSSRGGQLSDDSQAEARRHLAGKAAPAVIHQPQPIFAVMPSAPKRRRDEKGRFISEP